ncbi:hypothetical protein [Parafilimonas sp.]|uniref:hypothetical protein n=1 Tax=Parafilimonas sp. TaxID=1969739 RepID=UPI0039E3ECA0
MKKLLTILSFLFFFFNSYSQDTITKALANLTAVDAISVKKAGMCIILPDSVYGGGNFILADTTGLIADTGTVFKLPSTESLYLKRIINPGERTKAVWYGVVADCNYFGSGTDNAPALNRMFASLYRVWQQTRNYGSVELPTGAIGIKSNVYITNGCYVSGNGTAESSTYGVTKICELTGFSGNALFQLIPATVASSGRKYWVGSISSLGFLGNRNNSADSVWGMLIQDTTGDLHSSVADKTNFTDLTFTYNSGGGIYFTDASAPGNVTDCKFIFTNGPGIRYDRYRGNGEINFTECFFRGCRDNAFYFKNLQWHSGVINIKNCGFEDTKVNQWSAGTIYQKNSIYFDSCRNPKVNLDGIVSASTLSDTSGLPVAAGDFIAQTTPTGTSILYNRTNISWKGVTLEWKNSGYSDTLPRPSLIAGYKLYVDTVQEGAWLDRFNPDSLKYVIGRTTQWSGSRSIGNGVQIYHKEPLLSLFDSTGNTYFRNYILKNTGGHFFLLNLKDTSATPDTIFNTLSNSYSNFYTNLKTRGALKIGLTPAGASATDSILVKNTTDSTVKAIAPLPTLASGSYTSMLTNTTNITSSALTSATYIRNGYVVNARITGTITPTSVSTPSTLTFTLPTSTLTSVTQSSVGTITVTSSDGIVSYTSNLVDVNLANGTAIFVSDAAATSGNFVIQIQYFISNS